MKKKRELKRKEEEIKRNPGLVVVSLKKPS